MKLGSNTLSDLQYLVAPKQASAVYKKQLYQESLKDQDVKFLNKFDELLDQKIQAGPEKLNRPAAVNSPSVKQPTERDLEKAKVAGDFEALMLNMMVRSMRSSVGESGLVKKGNGQKVYQSMLDSQYSKVMSQKEGGLGISKMILDFLNQADGSQAKGSPVLGKNLAASVLPEQGGVDMKVLDVLSVKSQL